LVNLKGRLNRLKWIYSDNSNYIVNLKNIRPFSAEDEKKLQELEDRSQKLAQLILQTEDEIAYIEGDGWLERAKKMGRFANLAIPGGGHLVNLGACVGKAIHVGCFAKYSSCDQETKNKRMKAIAMQAGITIAKIAATILLSYVIVYTYSHFRS